MAPAVRVAHPELNKEGFDKEFGAVSKGVFRHATPVARERNPTAPLVQLLTILLHQHV